MNNDENLKFYFTKFNLTNNDIIQFYDLYETLREGYNKCTFDKREIFNIESLIKCIFLIIFIQKKKFNESLEEKETYIKGIKMYTKGDKKTNGKDYNIVYNYIKNFKEIIKNSEKDNNYIQITYDILKSFSNFKNLYNKLTKILLEFFEENEKTIKIKNLIWAVFIYIKKKLFKDYYNTLQCYYLLIYIFENICIKIKPIFFPNSFEITDSNIKEKVQEKLKIITHIENNDFQINNFSIENESLLTNLIIDLNKIEEIDRIKNIYFEKYENEFLKNKTIFDERIFIFEEFRKTFSPEKHKVNNTKFNLSNISKKRLFEDDKMFSEPKSINKSFVADKDLYEAMTPYSRIQTSRSWLLKYISDFDINTIINLQKKYLPENYKKELVPINEYVKSFYSNFISLANKKENNILINIDEYCKLCLKFIYILFFFNNYVFTEKFNSLLLFNEKFLKAIIAITFEIILFVETIEKISFIDLYESLGVDIYDIWKIINPMFNYDNINTNIPILKHLQEIEYQIISFLLWKNPSKNFRDDISSYFNENFDNNINIELKKLEDFEYNQQSLFLCHEKEDFDGEYIKKIDENEEKKNNIDDINYKRIKESKYYYKYLNKIRILFRRLINYCNLFNKNIFNKLGLYQSIAEESESFIKKILVNEEAFKIFYNHHIDQILLCCIICILKKNKLFTEKESEKNSPLISIEKLHKEYKEIKNNNYSEYIFTCVKKDIKNKNFLSLIDFYNSIFKVKLKYLLQKLIDGKKENERSYIFFENKPIKKSKLSENSADFEINQNNSYNNKSSFHDSLLNQSAYNLKSINYGTFIDIFNKKNNFIYINQDFKSKRTVVLRKLFQNSIKSEKLLFHSLHKFDSNKNFKANKIQNNTNFFINFSSNNININESNKNLNDQNNNNNNKEKSFDVSNISSNLFKNNEN